MIVCAIAWAIVLQDTLIGRIATDRYPGVAGWQWEARFQFRWNLTILTTETVVFVLAVLARALWRRSRGH